MQPDAAGVDWGTIADVVGILGGLGALILAVLGYRLSRRQTELAERQGTLDSVQTRLSRQLVEIEQGRDEKADRAASEARLRARIVRGREWTLVVENLDGDASAQNIRVALEGVPVTDFEIYVDGTGPADGFALAVGGEVAYMLAPHLGSPHPPWTVRLEWDDPSGRDRVWESTIT